MGRRPSCYFATLLACLGALWAGNLNAQATSPLRKTDLVRLLTNPALTKAQVAERIRGACLAFDPTGRDRTDLIAVGADAAVMGAIDECVRRKTTAAAPARPPAQPPAGGGARPATGQGVTPPGTGATGAPAAGAGGARGIRTTALQSRVNALAGTQAVLQVQVTVDGRPGQGVSVTLRAVGDQQGAAAEDFRALTDARGVATFRVPAGNATGSRRFAVTAVGDQVVTNGPEVQITTLPGPPAVAEVQPRRLEAQPGAPSSARSSVTVTIRDAHGNPVPNERVEFRPITPGIGINAFSGQTNRFGQLPVTVPTVTLRRSGEVGIFVRGERRGSIVVSVGPVVISEAQTRFVAGADQQGTVGQPLRAPLVFEVRDSSGTPVVGETVAFGGTNAEVTPPSATTDAQGRVSVTVTMGRRAGTSRVAAGVGAIRKEITIPAAPGPATMLVLRRDTVPVARTLMIQTRQPVVLRVTAVDEFGNEVPATGLRAVSEDPSVVRVGRVGAEARGAGGTGGGAGRVELRGQMNGATELWLEAAGVRQIVATQVLLPLAGPGWMLAGRIGWTAFDYSYRPQWDGRPGFVGEVLLGRGLGRGLSLMFGVTVAALKADTSVATPASGLSLLDGSVRVEYSVRPQAKVSPVVALGGGKFQTRSAELGDAARHSSIFWMAGAGLDYNFHEKVAFELRVTTHQLQEASSSTYKAKMGSLLALTAGIRLGN